MSAGTRDTTWVAVVVQMSAPKIATSTPNFFQLTLNMTPLTVFKESAAGLLLLLLVFPQEHVHGREHHQGNPSEQQSTVFCTVTKSRFSGFDAMLLNKRCLHAGGTASRVLQQEDTIFPQIAVSAYIS